MRIERRLLVIVLALAMAGAATTSAQATLIVGDFSSVDAGFGTGEGRGFALNVSLASAATSYKLESVVMQIGSNFGSTVSLALYDSVGGNPGAKIVDLGSVQVSQLIITDRTFTPAAPALLAAGSDYWIVVENTSNATPPEESTTVYSGSLKTSATLDPGSQPGVSIGYGLFRVSANDDWLSPSYVGPVFQLNGTAVAAVPEPSTLVAGALGLASLVLMRRRAALSASPLPRRSEAFQASEMTTGSP